MVFGPQSTTDEVLEGVDLSGKRIVVTGVSAGLGVETARALAAHGATVVGAARNLAKARTATEPVLAAAANGGGLEPVALDLASLASVRAAADAIVAQGKKLDAIIANAGVMACPQAKTADGFETQFGTNHLGHFVFVNRLVPLLQAGGRIVVLSSAGHRFSDVDLDDPNFEHTPYQEFVAYPGAIQTELSRHMTPDLVQQATGGRGIESVTFKTIPQGAATTVWAGFRAPAEEVGGHYCEDCHVAALTKDPTVRAGVRAYALDATRADALWTKSEEMVGERFPF